MGDTPKIQQMFMKFYNFFYQYLQFSSTSTNIFWF